MPFLLSTEIVINATPNKVWAILTDFKNYPNWNPFITLLTGDFEVGKKIMVRIAPPEAKVTIFKPTVTAFDVNKKISWLGIFIIRGVFDGEHNFELTDNGNGTTTLVQYENFTGILVPIFKKMLNDNTRRGFEAMIEEVKKLAEK
ncbi:SRPBCC domain-containing protein [Flavobacterium branchiarum]|uniref:SRPBCC family protein n=1 Tax=Flavobacterium branchiarum TaxID=1114870 RepID=A0ABV5FLJ4_9FLAO|nr:SRPBCC domain-containing protein [Flavobacterium branchiarum]MDN3674410.1 SRPBCC domain-containing protein [Flavobacterium branchiarum]